MSKQQKQNCKPDQNRDKVAQREEGSDMLRYSTSVIFVFLDYIYIYIDILSQRNKKGKKKKKKQMYFSKFWRYLTLYRYKLFPQLWRIGGILQQRTRCIRAMIGYYIYIKANDKFVTTWLLYIFASLNGVVCFHEVSDQEFKAL